MTLPTRVSTRSRNQKPACRSYRKTLWFRPRLEQLEDRTLLSAPGGVLGVIHSGVNALAPSIDPRGQTPPPNGPTHLGTVQPPVASTKSSGTIIGLDSAAAVHPPSLFQAMLSLYLDGAFLELSNLANEFSTVNLDEINSQANTQAAAAGINLDAAQSLGGFLGNSRGFYAGLDRTPVVSPDSLALADIQSNWPYAGLFAPFALSAGVEAAYQAVQQPPSS